MNEKIIFKKINNQYKQGSGDIELITATQQYDKP